MNRSVGIYSSSATMDRHSGLCWMFAFGALGVWTLVGAGMLGFALIPGDLGDARFNEYVLEHAFKVACGEAHSLWDAPFFYPYPMTLAFSANHLGSAPVFIVFRFIGLDRETAFQLWYLAGYLSSFIAANIVLLRLRASGLAAALGAFVFAFGLPALAQQNHAHLIWRAGIPIACYFMWRFQQTRSPRMLFAAALVTVWQLYAEIYLGVMLGMMLLAMAVFGGIAMPGGLRNLPKCWIGQLKSLATVRALPWVGGIAVLIGAALYLMSHYAIVAGRFHFQRDLAEVRLMLPQWRSYLLSDQSVLWSDISARFNDVPLRWEHQMFIGVGPIVLMALMVLQRPPARMSRVVWAHLIALVVLIVLTANVKNFSLYEAVLRIPGLSALRSVTRMILVMLWPIAVVVAAATTQLMMNRASQSVGLSLRIAAVVLAILTIGEIVTAKQYGVSKADAQTRTEAMKKQVLGALRDGETARVLLVAAGGKDGPLRELDAMLVAQDLNMPTMNGYSGSTPPGYLSSFECSTLDTRLEAYKASGIGRPISEFNDLRARTLLVGFSGC